MAIDGRVANRSESRRTGAIAEKWGTQQAIVRLRPAAVAAVLTGLAKLSPTRTTTCGQRDHAFGPHLRNAGWPRRAKHRQFSAPISWPVTPSGRRRSAGAMARSIWPSAISNNIGSRSPVHSIETAGASSRNRASRLVNNDTAKSGAASRNTRSEVVGSNAWRGERTRRILRKIGRACSINSKAKAVACMSLPPLIRSGSPSCSRSRDSEWLTADCVRPKRSAARVTPRSAMRTSNTTSRLRSNRRRSISFMGYQNYSFDR